MVKVKDERMPGSGFTHTWSADERQGERERNKVRMTDDLSQ